MLKLFSRVVDSNEREVRRLEPLVERANALEPEYRALSDDDLRNRTALFRERLADELGDLMLPVSQRPMCETKRASHFSPQPHRRCDARWKTSAWNPG